MAEYLVTGGCGFIGSHLCDALLARGDRVRVLDDLSSGKMENLAPGVRFVRGSVSDPAAVAEAMRGCDGVFHLAGIASVAWCNTHWRTGHLTNQTGSVTVFEAARDAGGIPVVYTSSAAVYGDAGKGPIDETRVPAPLTAYAVDKLGSELHGRAARLVHGVPAVGLRPFNIYGPRQNPNSAYSGVISIFQNQLARGLPVTVFGDGRQSRDFVFVQDVVKFLLAAMAHHAVAPAVFNICTGRTTTLLELIDILARLHGTRPEIIHADARAGDIRHSLGDPTRARSALGVTAEIPLEQGLEHLIAHAATRGAS